MHCMCDEIPPVVTAVHLAQAIQSRQHLHPHQTLGGAMARVGAQAGVGPEAAAAALRTLNLESQQSIGRLRSVQVTQLAHAMHRHWRAVAVSGAGVGL